LRAAHPELRLTVDHFGLGLGVVDDAIDDAVNQLWPVARHDNVAVKASPLPTQVIPEGTGPVKGVLGR
jgi:hypothetical protein